jgi:glutaminase
MIAAGRQQWHQPLTGVRAIEALRQNVLAVMQSCGMCDYSGEWCYRIGLPPKAAPAAA